MNRPSDDVAPGRRTFLRWVGSGTVAGIGSLSGCLSVLDSPQFDPERATSKTGSLPSHGVEELVEKVAEKSDASRTGGLEATATDGEYSLRSRVSGRDIGDPGKVAASSLVDQATYWRAPHSGEFEVTMGYDGHGQYEGQLICPDISGDRAAVFSMATLTVLKSPAQPVATDHQSYIHHGDNGSGSLSEQAAEELLTFLVEKVVKKLLSRIGGLVGTVILKLATDLVPLIVDLLGNCQNRYFHGGVDDVDDELSVRFSASEGETFKVQFTPITGASFESKVMNTSSYASVGSTFLREALSLTSSSA